MFMNMTAVAGRDGALELRDLVNPNMGLNIVANNLGTSQIKIARKEGQRGHFVEISFVIAAIEKGVYGLEFGAEVMRLGKPLYICKAPVA